MSEVSILRGPSQDALLFERDILSRFCSDMGFKAPELYRLQFEEPAKIY